MGMRSISESKLVAGRYASYAVIIMDSNKPPL